MAGLEMSITYCYLLFRVLFLCSDSINVCIRCPLLLYARISRRCQPSMRPVHVPRGSTRSFR
jgi:hypothetical protein